MPTFSLSPDEWLDLNPDEIDFDTLYEGPITHKSKEKTYFLDDGKTRLHVQLSTFMPPAEPRLMLQFEPASRGYFMDGVPDDAMIEIAMSESSFPEKYPAIIQEMYRNPDLFEDKEEILRLFGDVPINEHSHIIGENFGQLAPLLRENGQVKLSECIGLIRDYEIKR
jgi:hypothetical protein